MYIQCIIKLLHACTCILYIHVHIQYIAYMYVYTVHVHVGMQHHPLFLALEQWRINQYPHCPPDNYTEQTHPHN